MPLLKLSDWLCRGLAPFFARRQRLGQNFDERLVTTQGWADEIKNCPKKIWIQAASLGEAQLASQLAFELAHATAGETIPAQSTESAVQSVGDPIWELAGEPTVNPDPVAARLAAAPLLATASPATEKSGLKIQAGQIGLLLTSGTPEGRAELIKTRNKLQEASSASPGGSPFQKACFACVVRLFPLFTQTYMRRALKAAAPDLVVLLETELWPGLMLACAEAHVPLLVINARMSERSFKRYQLIKGLWKEFAVKGVPAHISAISEADAERYAHFFGAGRVSLMPNIKFDRAAASPAPATLAALEAILPPPEQAPTLLLASVRAEEEEQLAGLITKLRADIPGLLTLLVPKHLERSRSWLDRLAGQNIAHNLNGTSRLRLRTSLNPAQPARPGDIIIWDSSGELSALYAFARSTFVGGSLAPLGGQNFLEALSQGIKPHIGPHWKNFAWVGRDLLEQGLVKEVRDVQALATSLTRDLCEMKDRAGVRQAFSEWLGKHQGGTKQAADLIRNLLSG